MATSTATVLLPGTVVHQRYTIQEVRQYHDQYRRYLALDSADRFCLITEFPIQSQDSALRSRLKKLFEQKTAPLLNLNHPQLPRFTAAFRDGDGFFLVQEPPQGIPYRKFLKLRSNQGKSLTEPEVIHLLTHLLPALQELHARKLIHCKLSPDCIVLPVPQPKSNDALRAAIRHEVPMLVELGAVDSLARQIAALQTKRSSTDMAPIARLGYAPPEQVQTGRIYPHSDLYGLAVTCLELLTGQPPQKLLDSHTLTWSWQAYTSLSEPFEEILGKMLSWQPGDRYATAQDVIKALKAMQPSFQVGAKRSKAGLAELNTGSILSLESWTIDSFLRPRRNKLQSSAQTEQKLTPTTRIEKDITTDHSWAPQGQTQSPAQSVPHRPQSSEAPAPAPTLQWQAWFTLAFLSGTIVASSLLIAPGSRSLIHAVMPQARAPWQFSTWLQTQLSQVTPSTRPSETRPSEVPTEVLPDSSSAQAAELLNSDIPIPVYLSATSPEQSLDGSLRILPSQTYFVVGQPGQRLTAQLKSSGAELTVLDSELRPLDGTSNSPTQWQGELIGGDRTLFRVSGRGNYQLQLSLEQ